MTIYFCCFRLSYASYTELTCFHCSFILIEFRLWRFTLRFSSSNPTIFSGWSDYIFCHQKYTAIRKQYSMQNSRWNSESNSYGSTSASSLTIAPRKTYSCKCSILSNFLSWRDKARNVWGVIQRLLNPRSEKAIAFFFIRGNWG